MSAVFLAKTLPSCTLVQEEGTSHVLLFGEWTVHTVASLDNWFSSTTGQLQSKIVFSLKSITRLDTAGALYINIRVADCLANNKQATLENTNKRYTLLLETSQPVPFEEEGASLFWPLRYVTAIGEKTSEVAQVTGSLISFLGHFFAQLWHMIWHPKTVRWTSLAFYMEHTGLRAVPIVSLLTFLIGLVVAYMGMDELARFGAKTLTIKLVEVSIFRELGLIITSIVVAGRSSSSFAAQIGAMMANQEVAALRSMGLDPFLLLVMPRVLALILMLPLLVFISDIMGILGGAVAICFGMDMSFEGYIAQVYKGAKLWNFLTGIIKAPFCALAIGLVGCYQGFKASASAESVGLSTTVAVVHSIFLVVVIDAIMSIFFTVLGV